MRQVDRHRPRSSRGSWRPTTVPSAHSAGNRRAAGRCRRTTGHGDLCLSDVGQQVPGDGDRRAQPTTEPSATVTARIVDVRLRSQIEDGQPIVGEHVGVDHDVQRGEGSAPDHGRHVVAFGQVAGSRGRDQEERCERRGRASRMVVVMTGTVAGHRPASVTKRPDPPPAAVSSAVRLCWRGHSRSSPGWTGSGRCHRTRTSPKPRGIRLRRPRCRPMHRPGSARPGRPPSTHRS